MAEGGARTSKLSLSVFPNHPRFSRTVISRSSESGEPRLAVTRNS